MDEQQWPNNLPDAAVVRRWIVSVLPENTSVSETAGVLNAKGWSVVARFNIENGQQLGSVIFKMVALPQFRQAARVFDLLSRHCPGDVPHLLAWREDEASRAWMLFRPFMGLSVQETGRFDALLDMARTLAHIQFRVSALSSAETANLPRLPVEHVPDSLEALLVQIPGKYTAMWDADEGALRTRFAVSADIVERLASFLPQLHLWAEELRDCGLPYSLDHVDFLPHNAVMQENGRVLIYDWEQAVLSVPFFSLDILLAFAQGFETSRQASENEQADLVLMQERENAQTQQLRRAYLDAFAWGTAAQRERAFDLAMCLSPIRYAHAEWLLSVEFEQEHFFAEDMAWWLTRALRRWKRMQDKGTIT